MSGSAVDESSRQRRPRPSRALLLLVLLLFAEAAAVAAVTAFLIFELLTEMPDSYGSAIGLTALSAIAAVWLTIIAIHTLRGNSWIRGAVITVQILLIAIAVGSFQGLFARADIGWLLLAPATAVLVLLFTRSVIAATTRREE